MDIIKETLRWVNAEREARGIGPALDELPKGLRCSAYECPVAAGLGGAPDICVDGNSAVFNQTHDREDWISVDLPEAVQQFVDAFDDGEFPELVAE